MKHLIEYGNPEINIKRIRIDSFEDAEKMFIKLKEIAERRKYTWVISMWDADGFLWKSETINPTKIIKVNF